LPNILLRKRELKKQVFVKPEKLTYQPTTDSPEPDFDDTYMMGFGLSQNIEDAMKDILELNDNMEAKQPGETFRIDFRNENRKYFRLKDYKNKARMAS
jgi:hypothetical protein